ncbi:hypothetical protein WJX73_004319 [Symbiochloris irregularis]|uniref:F-box/LRR-repeat protein 15-like leucin rich repeat domain-containing protein n=1 Tax=Symbiochloris irregularis TaxID=706552 RepID=A0AAW1PME1_9CHLO
MADVQSRAPWDIEPHKSTGHTSKLSVEEPCAVADGVNELVEGVSECNLDLALELVERLRTRGFHLHTNLKITPKSRVDHWQQKAGTGHFDWAGEQVNDAARGAAVLFHAVVAASFQRCTALLDDGLARFAYGSCSQLGTLDLAGCRKLTDTGIAAVADACPHLRHLNISSCHLVTDWGFAQLGQACQKLRVLKACGCDRLGDAGLQALASGARHLQELNVGWCEHLGTSSLTRLAACCPDMRILNLCGCHKVTNEAVEAIARRCSQLENLGLYCCRRLTDPSMHAVAANLTTLQHINVSGCRSLGRAALQAVLDSNPQLHTCRSMHCNVIIGGCLALLDVSCICSKYPERSPVC